MCRTGGRRCDRRWDDAHRERYNARRRITRNSEKAEAARSIGNEGKASYYDALVASARATDQELTAAISAHEGDSHETMPPTPEVDPDDYRISHSAPSNNGYNKPLNNPVGIYPDDYADHPDWYGAEHEETIRQVRAAQGDPDHVVTVYRGVPRGVTRISRGDWVALSHDYAEQESMGAAEDGSEDGDVISARVPASTLFGEGSLEEWGYDGQQDIDTNDPPDPGTLGVSPAPDADEEASETGGEQRCPDCGQFAGPDHICDEAPPGTGDSGGHPLAASPAEPTDFAFIRNPESLAGNQAADHDFGQDLEPSGRYLTEGTPGMDPPPGWESGMVRFEHPLRMHWGESGLYTSEDNWKRRLSAHYDGKTGAELSQAVRDDGYDAIITHDKYGTSETVDLTHLSPATGGSSGSEDPAEASATGWDRHAVHGPREASEFGDHLEAKHGVTVRLHGGSRDDSYVTLSHIEVPKEKRGSGVGKAAMRELVEEADRNGWKLGLTPSGDYGGSVPKLKRFYKAFGFVENKGRNKDFETRETFLRPPQ